MSKSSAIVGFLSFLNIHGDLILSLFVSILSLVKVTRWGQAHQKALALVMDVVEKTKAEEVKQGVASASADAGGAVNDVISSTAQRVDPAKPNPSPWRLFLKVAVERVL